ncbi:hypothetical protein LSTR_LSTR001153 [Laodelphax striatellus]|uniref:Uncharacterized protein n=1 Tax=Laodelphax striatellus TaxID=195883 RepID=A0A482X1U2_LAOST|nr:hypothetical protein LSTR_LSTR001153 [Laodelphax striatellus]
MKDRGDWCSVVTSPIGGHHGAKWCYKRMLLLVLLAGFAPCVTEPRLIIIVARRCIRQSGHYDERRGSFMQLPTVIIGKKAEETWKNRTVEMRKREKEKMEEVDEKTRRNRRV